MVTIKNESFFNDLLWTSLRYCIGRHSYVVSMATDFGVELYNTLSESKKKNLANLIYDELYDQLSNNLPFGFDIDSVYRTTYNPGECAGKYNPIDLFMEFLDQENINDFDELYKYEYVTYNIDTNKFDVELNTKENTEKTLSHLYNGNIGDFLEWHKLATLFNPCMHHDLVVTDGENKDSKIKCFQVYVRDYSKNFGFKKYWKSVKEFTEGKVNYIIPEQSIKSIE